MITSNHLKFISWFSNTFLWKWLVTPHFCQWTSTTLLWTTVYILFVFWKFLISDDVTLCYSVPPPLFPLKLTLFSFTLFTNLHFNLHRNLRKMFNVVNLVQLIIFLCVISSFMYSHASSKNCSLYLCGCILIFQKNP